MDMATQHDTPAILNKANALARGIPKGVSLTQEVVDFACPGLVGNAVCGGRTRNIKVRHNMPPPHTQPNVW